MCDSEVIESCIKDIRRLLAEDNESINAMQRDVTLLSRLMPDNQNQLKNMLYKFNEERLKALLALTRSKIVMTDVIALITELRATMDKTSEKARVDANNKNENNNTSGTKTPSPNISCRRPSEHNRESPPSTCNKTAPLLHDSDTIHLLPILKSDPSPPQSKKKTSPKNVERESTSNKRKTSGDIVVSTKRRSRPLSESSIDFIGSEDALLPDVELSRQLQNIPSNQVTGLSPPEQSFNFKIPKISDTVHSKPTGNIKPAQHTGDPEKFKIKKVLESNANMTPKEQQNNLKNNIMNVQEPKNRHIPIAPIAANLKKRATLITLPPIDPALKTKYCFGNPFAFMPPESETPPPLICPKKVAASTKKNKAPVSESPKNEQSVSALKCSDNSQTPTSKTHIDKTPSRAGRRYSYDSSFTKSSKRYTSSPKSNSEKDKETPRSKYSDHNERPSTPKYPAQSPKYKRIVSRPSSRDPRIFRRNHEDTDSVRSPICGKLYIKS